VTRPSVSVVIVAHNEGENLLWTVSAFRDTSPQHAEIVVVDDWSDDGSIDRLRAEHPSVRVTRPPQRLGTAPARNHGAALARGDTILWADGHVAPRTDWFNSFAPILARDDVGAVGPVVAVMGKETTRGHGMRWKSARLDVEWLPAQPHQSWPVPMLGAFFLAMRREVFEQTGGFDDGLLLWGGTDVELCFRLQTLGLECILAGNVVVPHLFRQKFPYAVPAMEVLHNILRIAFVHFDEERIARVVEARRSDPAFPRALARVATSDAANRRAAMRALRIYSDRAVLTRFPMIGLSDEAPGEPQAALNSELVVG
jgi:GT2 family glycosyltransferase